MNLSDLIIQYAPSLDTHSNIDPIKLLTALAKNESNFGLIRRPRYERSYAPGGSLYNNSKDLRNNYSIWGAWASCSYGSFQIMFQTASELGFKGCPKELWLPDDSIGIQYVVHLLNNRILPKANTIENIADAYNSGSFQDSIIPADYINKFVQNYKLS